MRPNTLAAIAGAALALLPLAARADSWRFCVSASFDERRAYISDVFNNASSRPALEKWFDQTLSKHGLRHDFVQCPLGNDKAFATNAHAYAEEFNEGLGFKIVPVR